MGIKDWSTTPGSNGTISGINVAEGCLPGNINDAIRQLMADVRQGQIDAQNDKPHWCGTAGGTADALTLTPDPAITAYVAGQTFSFVAAAANTGAVTVAISSLAAKAVNVNGTALAAGQIVAGSIYRLRFDGTSFQLAPESLGTAATRHIGTGAGQVPTSADIPSMGKMIGEVFALWDHIPGVTAPDNSGSAKYIKLTAGESGVGGYNNGLLTSETTSGSAPTIVSTAVISLADSPLNGRTVILINTERRFVRPGSSGTRQDSQNASHTHVYGSLASAGLSGGFAVVGNTGNNYAVSYSGGDEARPSSVGATYYMRVR